MNGKGSFLLPFVVYKIICCSSCCQGVSENLEKVPFSLLGIVAGWCTVNFTDTLYEGMGSKQAGLHLKLGSSKKKINKARG